MVQVSIPGGKGWMGGSDQLTVTLRSVQPAVTLNLNAISGTPGNEITPGSNTPVSITMYRMEQPDASGNYLYRALVPAQDVAAGNSLFFFDHEGRQLFTDGALSSPLAMTAGRAEKFSYTLPASVIETVKITAGTFLMGSPADEPNRQSNETQHEVTLTKDFRMSKYPVTFAQYDAFCAATSQNNPSDNGWGLGDRPVINVSWNNAVAYCAWLSAQTGQTWQLPTEAQWEYACRGGQTESLPFGIGDGSKLTYDMANFYTYYPYDIAKDGQYYDVSGTGYLGKTTAVGSYPANGYGLYDMHGNVWEWCADWYASNYGSTNASDAATDPTGPTSGFRRVLRGGSWYFNAQSCRSAYRYDDPDFANFIIGFRVAVVP